MARLHAPLPSRQDMEHQSFRWLLALLLLYLVTGLLQPTLVDALRLRGALVNRWLLIPTLCNTLGMAMCGIVGPGLGQTLATIYSSKALQKRVLLGSVVDLVSGMMLTGGLLLTGSAVFSVLYNSVPAWTAVLSWTVLHRRFRSGQIAGVLMVTFGLALNVLGTHQQLGGDSSLGSAMVGSCLVLVGSFLHSAMFVLTESTVHSADSCLPALHWSCCLGVIESVAMTLWIGIGLASMALRGGGDEMSGAATRASSLECTAGFALLVLVDAGHALAFFALLSRIGAVSASLLKGVQTIAIVVASAVLLCEAEQAQCLTLIKSASVGLVILGTTLYAAAGRNDDGAYTSGGTQVVPMTDKL